MNTRNPKIDSTSASLIERVKNDQNGAWDELARLYLGLLNGWMAAYSKNRFPVQECDAHDIIQEVWLSVRRDFKTFVLLTGRRSFRPWLRTILARRIADHVRKKKREENARPTKNATDLAAEMREDFTSLEDVPQENADVKEFDAAVEHDDENERATLLESAMMIISEELGIDPRYLKVFYQRRYTDRSNASIGNENDVSDNNVSVITGRVSRKINSAIEDGVLETVLAKYEPFLD